MGSLIECPRKERVRAPTIAGCQEPQLMGISAVITLKLANYGLAKTLNL